MKQMCNQHLTRLDWNDLMRKVSLLESKCNHKFTDRQGATNGHRLERTNAKGEEDKIGERDVGPHAEVST